MAIDLKSICKGKQSAPPRIIVYSEHGMGKSTFGAAAPKPIFLQTEDGLGNIDTSFFPLASSYDDVLGAIGTLYTDDHDYQTVVLDSLDWLEKLIWKHVAAEHEKANIEGFGYGKGYIFAADRFHEVLAGLNALRLEKSMCVILTAHHQVKRFDDPAAEPYDRYQLKLNSKAAGICQEWADVIAFCAQEMTVRSEDVGFDKKAARGIPTGGRVMHLTRAPAWDAKNRYGLPDKLPFNWSAFSDALTEALTEPKPKPKPKPTKKDK